VEENERRSQEAGDKLRAALLGIGLAGIAAAFVARSVAAHTWLAAAVLFGFSATPKRSRPLDYLAQAASISGHPEVFGAFTRSVSWRVTPQFRQLFKNPLIGARTQATDRPAGVLPIRRLPIAR
jgi:hypothetical protein